MEAVNDHYTENLPGLDHQIVYQDLEERCLNLVSWEVAIG